MQQHVCEALCKVSMCNNVNHHGLFSQYSNACKSRWQIPVSSVPADLGLEIGAYESCLSAHSV